MEPETSTLKPLWFFGMVVSFLCYFFLFISFKKKKKTKREIALTEHFSNRLGPAQMLKLCPATLSLINHSDHFTFSGILSADFLLPFPLPQKCFQAPLPKKYVAVSLPSFRTLLKCHILSEMFSYCLSILREKTASSMSYSLGT